jgi:hypothetical protein
MTNDRREPFKEPPMRLPGQSGIDSRNRRLARDVVVGSVALGVLGIILGMNLGLLWQRILPPLTSVTHWIVIACSALLMTFGYLWVTRILKRGDDQDHNDILGIRGERVVAQALDELKRDGYHVFHDVPPEREARDGERLANFDHVVIGPTGVFVIETKTRSIANGNNEVVITTDGRVLVNKMQPDRCPLRQARALAAAMRRTLEQDSGIASLPVRPVVVFPGEWYIKDRDYRNAGGEVWTLRETAFAKWVRSPKENVRLTEAQIEQLASCLSKRCRVAVQ